MKKFHLIVVFLLGGIHTLFAQQCEKTLTGKVIDFHDGKPLESATISFDNQTITTANDGSYTIVGLCKKTYAFTIGHAACNSQVIEVNLEENDTYTFYLEHHVTDLETVDLYILGDQNHAQSLTTGKIDQKKLEYYSSQTLGDALTEVTGVTSLSTGYTIVKPVIQGLHSSRVVIINNGVRQEDQEWGEEHAPNIDLNAFDELQVIKGAGALQYGGDAIGGVIVGKGKLTKLQDTIFGKANIAAGSNGRGGTVGAILHTGLKNNWSAKFQGNLKKYGDFETPDYVLSNTGTQEQSFSAAFGKQTFRSGIETYYSFYRTVQGILRASHIGNVGDLVRAIASDRPLVINDFTYDINAPKQETQHHLAKLKTYYRFKKTGKLSLQYAFQFNNRKEFDIRRGDDRGKASLDLELQTHTLDANMVFDHDNTFTKSLGIQVAYQQNIPNSETGIRRLIPDYLKTDIGAYALTAFNIGKTIHIDAGLRYDFTRMDVEKFYLKKNSVWESRNYSSDFSDAIVEETDGEVLLNPVFDFHNLAASAGIKYAITAEDVLKFNIALVNRAPNPAEFFSDGLHHSAAIIEVGDLRLEQENALKFGFNYETEHLFSNTHLSIAPHLSSINNFILLEPTGVQQTIRGAFPVWEYRQTRALLYGIDVDFGISILENLELNTGFSYTYGQDLDLDKPIINIPAPNINSSLSFQQNRWDLSLKHVFAMEQQRFPNTNFEVNTDQDGNQNNTQVDISTPPEGYNIFHLFGTYKLPLGKNNTLNIGLNIQNMFNASYRDYLNRQRFYATQTGRNFIIQFKYKF